MTTPEFDLIGLLTETGRPASVATVSSSGGPALAMMWFMLAQGRLWFHSPRHHGRPAPFLRAAERGADVAVMVATFSPPDDIRQIRLSGPARMEEPDDRRVRAIYQRYLPQWTPAFESQAVSSNYRLWSMSPDRGMAVAFAGLRNAAEARWSTATEFRAACDFGFRTNQAC
jgi:hypothetical protein